MIHLQKISSLCILGFIFAILAGGCNAAPSSATAIASLTAGQPVNSPTTAPMPSGTSTPTPTLTVVPSLTPTVTFTPTISLTPTQTSTPTRTPSRTPAYNLPGLHQVNRCGRTTLKYSDELHLDPNGSFTFTMDVCVTTALVNKDGTMQFNMEWRLLSYDGPEPSRYMYASNDYMTLGDTLGNWYGRIGDSGRPVDNDNPGGKENTYMGWYLFPVPVAGSKELSLYDTGKGVVIPGIVLYPGK